ncbi:MAG: divergent PAP2 family protein [Lachnospiraceae bacterium]|nr:divergent PAP2 family protein [Lachnospiraceae bacterium]
MKTFLLDLVRNEVLMSAALSWALAQIIKTIIHLCMTKKFVPERLIGSGGMPSCHSAAVCAMVTSLVINEGVSSYFVAIAGLLAIVVMYDATGVRRETGNQAKVLNEFIELFQKNGSEISNDDKLKEFVGHTPFQVLCGAILGIAFAFLYCLVIVR